MLEQDAHLLEEQRYLNRLKNAQIQQNVNVKRHYREVTIPELEKKKKEEEYHQALMEQRIATYAKYQDHKK